MSAIYIPARPRLGFTSAISLPPLQITPSGEKSLCLWPHLAMRTSTARLPRCRALEAEGVAKGIAAACRRASATMTTRLGAPPPACRWRRGAKCRCGGATRSPQQWLAGVAELRPPPQDLLTDDQAPPGGRAHVLQGEEGGRFWRRRCRTRGWRRPRGVRPCLCPLKSLME